MQQKTKLLLALITASITIWGCNVNKRQIRKLDDLTLQQPAEAARLANLINPCFTGKAKSDTVVKTVTVTTPGAQTTNTIYIKGKGDTIIKTITITLPGSVTTKTINIHDTVPDTRSITVLNNQLKAKSDSLVVVKTHQASTGKNLNIWRWIAIGCMALIVIFLVVKIYGLVSGGAVVNVAKKVL